VTPQPPANEPEPAFGQAEPAAEEQQYEPDEVWSTVPASRASTVDTAEEAGRRRKFMMLGIAGAGLAMLIIIVVGSMAWLGAASELGQFQGDWVDQGNTPYSIQGNRILRNQEEIATFSIDATTTPGSIDWTWSTGESKDRTMQGIYELKGNRLILYLANPGQNRPTQIDRGDGRRTWMQLSRVTK
jgi:uncharacterized protein (TIGR03067 family)